MQNLLILPRDTFKFLAGNRKAVALYLLVPIRFENPTAGIDTSVEILTPIIYEPDRKEILG